MLTRQMPLVLAIAALGAWTASPALAIVQPGQAAVPFTKNQVVSGTTGSPISLADYAGKIVLLFQIGYNCPVCLGDGPSVESDLWQHYQSVAPGRVQVLGADMWNGTAPQLQSFRTSTGATYPLLLLAGTATGTGNDIDLTTYGPFDNHVIIDASGVVRFNAYAQGYAHGSRYDLTRMRALVDSLLANAVGVGGGVPSPAASLSSAPNPFSSETRVEFALPAGYSGAVRVRVFDLTGRQVATLYDGEASGDRIGARWDGRDRSGRPVAAGVYLVRAEANGLALTRRIVRAR